MYGSNIKHEAMRQNKVLLSVGSVREIMRCLGYNEEQLKSLVFMMHTSSFVSDLVCKSRSSLKGTDFGIL